MATAVKEPQKEARQGRDGARGPASKAEKASKAETPAALKNPAAAGKPGDGKALPEKEALKLLSQKLSALEKEAAFLSFAAQDLIDLIK